MPRSSSPGSGGPHNRRYRYRVRISVVRRARGDRAAGCQWRWGAGDRASARSVAVDDLEGAASECRDPRRRVRVSRHHRATCARGARSQRNSSSTSSCATMFRIACPGLRSVLTAWPSMARMSDGSVGATVGARTAVGRGRGARSRSQTAALGLSLMACYPALRHLPGRDSHPPVRSSFQDATPTDHTRSETAIARLSMRGRLPEQSADVVGREAARK